MMVKVWRVIEGPVSIEELDDISDAPDGAKYLLICRAEAEGSLGDDNFWFEHFDDAYAWVNHFSTEIDPIVIDMTSPYQYN